MFTLKGAATYDLFGDKFDLNHDGGLSAAEHMMDFSVFNYWAADDRDRSSKSYYDDDNDFDNCDSDDYDDGIGDDFGDDDQEDELW